MDLTMPTEWERSIRERLMAGDCRALEELYDQFSAFVGLRYDFLTGPEAQQPP